MVEVAARTGVSVTTVSHVLNDVPGRRIPWCGHRPAVRSPKGVPRSSGSSPGGLFGPRQDSLQGLLSDACDVERFVEVIDHPELGADLDRISGARDVDSAGDFRCRRIDAQD